MRPFKFLNDNQEDVFVPTNNYNSSWMWANEHPLTDPEGYHWELTEHRAHGIESFLHFFPNGFIIPVHSITCNGIRHDCNSPRFGWGFDITSDLLFIEYYTLIPNETN